jgi:hypothetical protein
MAHHLPEEIARAAAQTMVFGASVNKGGPR